MFLKKIFYLFLIYSSMLFAQAGSYYSSISTSSPTFVEDLKARVRSPYTKISYDQFDETNITNYAAQPDGMGGYSVTCVYTGYVYSYTGTFAWGTMSREHTFCHSWMPTYPSTSGEEYSDQHHLFPTHQNNANGRRSNHPLGIVTNVTYQFLDGKLGTNAAGEVVYEPRDAQKGDAARALFYMCLKYDDIGGYNLDFNWLNGTILPQLSEGQQDLNLLLAWHESDPPDAWETGRNDYIQSIQQNRNPFIDHPEYVNYINFNDMSYISQTSSNTSVSFNSSTANVFDNSSTYNLIVNISSPSAVNPTSVDVVLISGNASEIGNYTTQTLAFPAGSSSSQSLTININNSIGDKTFVFNLQNPLGGDSVQIGTNSTFTLNVKPANDKGVIISEYSDAYGTGNYIYEFVELYNESSSSVDLSNSVVRQINSALSFTIPANTIVQSNGFVVIGRNSSQAAFESFWQTVFGTNVIYINSGNKLPQLNGDEQYLLETSGGINIDPKTDNEYSAIPISVSNRVYRISAGNSSSDWTTATWNTANPGQKSSDQSLPVELILFSVRKYNSLIQLNWQTATEVNNYGFEIERQILKQVQNDSNSWQKIGFVQGHGNSNSPKDYSFIDQEKVAERSRSYRLKQIDIDGGFRYSQEVEVKVEAISTEFTLFQNYPNPFNPSTTIKYSIPNNMKSEMSNVKIVVFDILGNVVATLVNENKAAGNYEVKFDGSNLSSGVYFYKLQSGSFVQTKKFLLMK